MHKKGEVSVLAFVIVSKCSCRGHHLRHEANAAMVLAKKPAPPSSPSRTAAVRAIAAASESVAIACGSLRRDTIEKPHLVVADKEITATKPQPSPAEGLPCSRQTLSHSSLGSDHGSFMPGFVLLGVGAAFIDKDAPLEDEEIKVLFLVNIHASSMYGRLNIDRIHLLIKARREEQIQAAHDEAMFGASALPPPTSTDSEPERENEKEVDKKAVVTSLLSETVSGFTADLCE
ncbi:hypothetical protein HN51_012368 [Arachis hypogaea]